jgi:hypothetical protein
MVIKNWVRYAWRGLLVLNALPVLFQVVHPTSVSKLFVSLFFCIVGIIVGFPLPKEKEVL